MQSGKLELNAVYIDDYGSDVGFSPRLIQRLHGGGGDGAEIQWTVLDLF